MWLYGHEQSLLGFYLTMAVIVKSCYYDDQKSRNVTLTESNDLEMTVSENHDPKS